MAFVIDNFNNTSSGAAFGPRVWTYGHNDDTLAEISVDGYFDEIFGTMSKGDMLYVSASDGNEKRVILSERYTKPVQTGGYIFNGQVQTADIVNDAVTADKIAASAAGPGLTGGAGSALAVQPDNIGLELNANTLRVKNLGVTRPKLALNIPRTATGSVTPSQWIGMASTPVLLVPAPGANKMHRVLSVRYEMDYNSAQYSGGGVVAVQYDSVPSGAGTLASATVANTVFNAYVADSVVGAQGAVVSGPSSAVVNKGLYLSTPTAFTSGNSLFRLHLTYETVDTTV